MNLHEELVAETAASSCTICIFLAGLSERERQTWRAELAQPCKVIGHTAITRFLKKRHDLVVSEKSVRRHREAHQ